MTQFEIGNKYRADGVQYVCVDRYEGAGGETVVGFTELAELRRDLKDSDFVPYHEARRGGFATHEEIPVRVFDGVERAARCEGAEDADDCEFRADSPCGAIDLAGLYAKAAARTEGKSAPRQAKGKKRNEGGGAVVGLVILAVVAYAIYKFFVQG